MIRGAVFLWLKNYIKDYLLILDKEQLNMSVFSGELDFSRANLKPDKVNEKLAEYNLPFVIKAGMFK